jgi:hypothetical protein
VAILAALVTGINRAGPGAAPVPAVEDRNPRGSICDDGDAGEICERLDAHNSSSWLLARHPRDGVRMISALAAAAPKRIEQGVCCAIKRRRR